MDPARRGREKRASLTRVAAETRARLDALLTLTADAVISIDANGIVETFNQAAELLFGYPATEVIGRNVRMLMPEPDASRHTAYIQDYLRTGHTRVIGIGRETVARKMDGSVFPVALAVTESRIAGNRLFTGVIRDLTEVRETRAELDHYRKRLEVLVTERTAALLEANRKLQELAMTDALTGLANRRHFDNTLEREFARAVRTTAPLSLVLCDVDYFKNYNDHYGHVAGDRCLAATAEVIASVLRRATDLGARYGGEEFGLILPDTDFAQCVALAERLRSAVSSRRIPHASSQVADHVTMSLGAATMRPGAGACSRDLVECADRAQYAAKKGGRNQVRVARCDCP